MSQADLNALERNVEQARARFANDLARLRSPVNLARFKDELWAEARETKDELVEKTKEVAKDGAQRVLTQLTERVAANPAAALAIGAGLAWRLFHRPPIATLLVGMGLVGLLRTSQHSSQPYMGLQIPNRGTETMRVVGALPRLPMSQRRKYRIGVHRLAKRSGKPERRSRTRLHRWLTGHPLRCTMLVTPPATP